MCKPSLENDALHGISKRFVLFPRYSVVQITGGLSVPAIFPRRSINLSLGFQMNHDLPYNLTNFEPSKDFGDHNAHIDTSLEHKVLVAERLGRIHGECYKIFKCPLSLLDLFTNKYY
ncbi:uncharacterized protein [Atheta coriaria]|uniref:uncharacterized protein n=1 Tax=Dalotia coriaria TaxID=877792 RepID=UPI0031F44327